MFTFLSISRVIEQEDNFDKSLLKFLPSIKNITIADHLFEAYICTLETNSLIATCFKREVKGKLIFFLF